ncbi:MAG TPA: cytochrome b/b6 domain-containing protein, partial [Casimicrobiaceae bacterium]
MSPSDRYTRTAIALHWIIALAVIAQFTWGWVMLTIPKQPPGLRADAFNLHKSVGLTILALMILRALWRWRHPAPPLPA